MEEEQSKGLSKSCDFLKEKHLMCSTALYLLFGKRDAEGKRVQVAVASCDGGLGDGPGPVIPAWCLPGGMVRTGMGEMRRL